MPVFGRVGLADMRERFHITSVDTGEVLRYMGYSGQAYDPSLDVQIEKSIARAIEVSTPSASWRVFDVAQVHGGAGKDAAADGHGGAGGGAGGAGHGTPPWIELLGCALKLEGRDIVAHLEGARKVGVFAATLGMANERELHRLSLVDHVAHVAFDAASTTLVERAADAAEASIMAYAGEQGLYTNSRFSPGYGDMPLACQPTLLATVDAGRALGITLSPSLLMTPTKSVTAVVGMFDSPQESGRRSCRFCACREFCSFRMRGMRCYGT